MSFFRRARVLGLGSIFVALAASCSDSKPGLMGDTDGGPVTIPDGGGKDGAKSDAGDATADTTIPDGDTDGEAGPVACNALVADGPLVPETALSGSPPDAVGGQIFAGTYFLTERDAYATAPDGLFVQRTLFFDATTIDIVEGTTTSAVGVPALTTRTTSYEVLNEIVFSTRESCPGPPHTVNITFTAVGGQLTLYPTSDFAEIYTLQ